MRRAPSMASLLLILGLAAACGGQAPTGPSSPMAPTPPGSLAPPAATPTLGPSPLASPSAPASPTPTASREPSARPSPLATPPPTPGPTAADGFICTYPLRRPGNASPIAAVTDVRVGSHSGYDRVVFEFEGSAVPGVRLDRVSPPFEKDPSGLPLAVEGRSFVRILLEPASGEGYARPDGEATYTGPGRFSPGFPRVTSLVRAGDFEAQLTWIAGLTGPACHHVFVLRSPTRLVIDFEVP
jgi:hypothetical protein